MALPSNYGIEKNRNSMAGLSAYENGGPGSGNFGHAGRPGLIGGSGGRGIGASSLHIPKQQINPQSEKSGSDDFDSGIQIEGGSPEALLNLSDSPRELSTATGTGSKYSDGEIRVGYDVTAESPFTIDKKSQDALQEKWDEMDNNRKQSDELRSQRDALVESGDYRSSDGWQIRGYSSEEDVMGSNMPADKKAQWKELKNAESELSKQWHNLYDECQKISEKAQYTPRNLGAKGAVLVAGLAKGISEYLGQRSDGAGEGSFNDRTKAYVNSQSYQHKTFIDALKHPESYTDASFNSARDASAKLAKSQATYLKRVENSINEPNFMGSKEFSNVASTIKKIDRFSALEDKYNTGSSYVTFEGGIPKIHKK